MTTKGKKSKVENSTIGKDNEKTKVKKIKKSYVELKTKERANLKQLSKRKFISQKAIKQVFALLLFDTGATMTEVMEELALSPQTLMQLRKDFKMSRMDSLLVFQEKNAIEKEEDMDPPENFDKQD